MLARVPMAGALAPSHTAGRERGLHNSKPACLVVDEERPTAIVGIGASAGGVEALQAFMEGLHEEPRFSYVVVPHLNPTGDSRMASILQRATDLDVVEIKDGDRPRPRTVHVLPVSQELRIEEGRFRLRKRPGAGHDHVIDRFFSSLAADAAGRAVGIVLSGTLSDGTIGIQELRRAEAYTMAQDPDTAEYDEMPRSAIRTGLVDFVLPPKRMGEQLLLLATHLGQTPMQGPAKDNLTRIQRLVRTRTGIDLSLYKDATLGRRIQRRMLRTGCSDLSSYLRVLESHQAEADAMIDEILISVTGFFRDPDVWKALAMDVLPDMLKRSTGNKPVRVWVPGCATGEEAYTIAMLLADLRRQLQIECEVQIFGTDLSKRAIDKARAGIYPEAALQDVPKELRSLYFDRQDGAYRVARTIRSMCIFAVHDLTKDPPFSGVDMLSCRNLLIYMQPAAQQEILTTLHYALKPMGTLVLGSSEAVHHVEHQFDAVHDGLRIFLRRAGAGRSSTAAPRRIGQLMNTLPASERVEAQPKAASTMLRAAERAILDDSLLASTIISKDLRIVSTRGEANRFLRLGHGRGDMSLLGSLRAPAAAVKTMIEQAQRTDQMTKRRIQFTLADGTTQDIIVTAHVLLPERSHLVLTFREPDDPHTKKAPKLRGLFSNNDEILARRLREAEARVDSIVEQYETTMEQLNLTNEELMSTNEELQSANEELQTATEESQSSSEELRTLNDELVARNKVTQAINDDLANLLEILDVPILMLDRKGRIGRATQAARVLFDLDKVGEGTQFRALRGVLDVDLSASVNDVLRTMQAAQFDAIDRDGRAWSVEVRPYKSSDQRLEGAIILMRPLGAVEDGRATAHIDDPRARA